MTFKYTLPEPLIRKATQFYEFANGGAVATVRLKNSQVHEGILVSNSMWLVAMRGHEDLPFAVAEIEDIFQTEEDKKPRERTRWQFWDDWGPLRPQ